MTTRPVRLTDRLRRLGVLLVLAATLGAPSLVWTLQPGPWTSVGSAGTVDEADTDIVQFGTAFSRGAEDME
jgi:hypothetical protein